MENSIELLSPAGDMDALKAAIFSGADAVYVGGRMFGARAYAKNFSDEELLYAIDFVHLYGRKLYLTVNTVFKDDEIEYLKDFIEPFYINGLDGVIVQDIGVVSILREFFKDMEIHASTQMAITDTEGVKLLENLGISRVVLARELSLEEILRIKASSNAELECFIHGALCYSYSGKCLFSSIVGERSGNRGRCAQPCRLPYNDTYLLSCKDICTLEMIPKLCEAGIKSFKIEGRMKSAEYVAGVTGIYRKYIDLYFNAKGKFKVDKTDLDDLLNLYTRSGNCSGYYEMKNGREMITLSKPCYNSASEEDKKKLFNEYTSKVGKNKISGYAAIVLNDNISLSVSYGDISVSVTGQIAEIAQKRAITDADVIKQLKKTGDSEFVFNELEIYLDDNCFVPVSELNNLRRNALDSLREEILKKYRRNSLSNVAGDEKRSFDCVVEKTDALNCKVPLINCRIYDLELLDSILSKKAVDIVSIDFNAFVRGANRKRMDLKCFILKYAKLLHENGKKFQLVFPRIIRSDFFNRYNLRDLLLCGEIDGVVADNYETLYYLRSIDFGNEIVADIHLYCLNKPAVNKLKDLSVTLTSVPVELNKKELISRNVQNEELICYGKLPMMVSAQCVQKTIDKCAMDNGSTAIKDRLGNEFEVYRDCSECINVVLNNVPNLIVPTEGLIKKLKPHSLRLTFYNETPDIVALIIDYYEDLLSGKSVEKLNIPHTTAHFNRGVL